MKSYATPRRRNGQPRDTHPLDRVVFFETDLGLPDEIRNHPSGWLVYALPGADWMLPVYRVGEDPDAREARCMGHPMYKKPLPPAMCVPPELETPYRRRLSRGHLAQ